MLGFGLLEKGFFLRTISVYAKTNLLLTLAVVPAPRLKPVSTVTIYFCVYSGELSIRCTMAPFCRSWASKRRAISRSRRYSNSREITKANVTGFSCRLK